jgi:anti-anti-sigma factor
MRTLELATGDPMLLEIEKTDEPRGLRLVGEVDASNVDALNDAIEKALGSGGDFTLDLGGLAFMDSSGVQVLIRTAMRLQGQGKLILIQPGDVVRRILDLIPVTKLENVEVRDEEPDT